MERMPLAPPHPHDTLRVRSVFVANGWTLAALLACGMAVQSLVGTTAALIWRAAVTFELSFLVAVWYARLHHPFLGLGAANQVTTLRLALVALLAGLVLEPATSPVATAAAAAGLTALALDGVDGWLARRTGLASGFGARYDMEVDTLLIIVLAVLVWRHDKAGIWILAAGLLRYGFVGAARIWRWLSHPLPERRRRKIACVVQVAALGGALVPGLPPPASALVAGGALVGLVASFAVDVWWLVARHRAGPLEPLPAVTPAAGTEGAPV